MKVYQRGTRWWIEYWRDGERLRESVHRTTGKNGEKAATALLKKRVGEIEANTWIGPDEKKVRLSDLRTLLDADYVDRQRRSADRIARAWNHIVKFFPRDPRALSITTKNLYDYVTHRRAEGVAPATIRNELAALRRAFRVAVERQELQATSVPGFPTIAVKNARDVFYSWTEVEAVRGVLPAALRNLWTVCSWTGWRRNELFGLTWDPVDFTTGIVRLDVNSTKNDAGREVPFDRVPALLAAFLDQRRYADEVERRTGQAVPWVFHRNGKPIRRMDIARQRACLQVGAVGKDGRPKVLHDLRRTTIRQMTRAGVPRHVIMAIVGLKSEAVYRRSSKPRTWAMDSPARWHTRTTYRHKTDTKHP